MWMTFVSNYVCWVWQGLHRYKTISRVQRYKSYETILTSYWKVINSLGNINDVLEDGSWNHIVYCLSTLFWLGGFYISHHKEEHQIVWLWNIGFWWGNRRERDHWGDPDTDGRIILRGIFRKWEGVVENGWSWLRIGTGGGHLWVRWWTFGFRKMRGISWLAAEPVSFSRRTLLHGVST